MDGQRYQVSRNKGENSLHGGTHGWSSKVWNASIDHDRVIMTLISPNDDEGYPGRVTARVTFQLTDDGELRIDMTAESPVKATPINLTNHSYFNLAGHVRSTLLIPPLMREIKHSSLRKNSSIAFSLYSTKDWNKIKKIAPI